MGCVVSLVICHSYGYMGYGGDDMGLGWCGMCVGGELPWVQWAVIGGIISTPGCSSTAITRHCTTGTQCNASVKIAVWPPNRRETHRNFFSTRSNDLANSSEASPKISLFCNDPIDIVTRDPTKSRLSLHTRQSLLVTRLQQPQLLIRLENISYFIGRLRFCDTRYIHVICHSAIMIPILIAFGAE